MTTPYKKKLDNKLTTVIDYIDKHLDGELSLDNLAAVGNLSKYHFHRLFTASIGLPIGQYIALQRLNVAAYQLAFRTQLSITDIALSAVFSNPESFSRTFKKVVGQTPSDFRNKPLWQPWLDKQQLINKFKQSRHQSNLSNPKLTSEKIMNEHNNNQVTLIEFKTIKVAALEHKGNPNNVLNSVQKFIAWRKENKLPPHKYRTFNIVYNDPNTVEPEDYQIDICVEVKHDISDNNAGIINKKLAGGRYAKLRHIGSDITLANSFNYLYGQWLAQSGESLIDAPCFIERVKMFPDVAEHEMIIDIFLPLVEQT